MALVKGTRDLAVVTTDLPVLFGVLGTLVGVTLATATQQGDAAELLAAFKQAFPIAVQTTIVGGLVHATGALLGVVDGFVLSRSAP